MLPSTERRVIAGVDTHGDVHVIVVLDAAIGRRLADASFATTRSGYVELLAWLLSFGTVDKIGVESTGSYGAGLARYLTGEGIEVIEVRCPNRQERRMNGKNDTIDAEAAARSVLAGTATARPKTGDGPVASVRALEVVYHAATKDRTRAINQFKAQLVCSPTVLRDRLRAVSFHRQLELARRFNDQHPDPVEREIRFALKELARRIGFLDDQTARLEARIRDLAAQTAPALVGLSGVGPHVAAQLLAAAGDNPDRLSSEASFAKLCGACPIPAGSGKTNGRHRLNRGGDRRANNALFTIVLVRMRHDEATRRYVKRRTHEGKNRKEIMRCLKRYVAREVFHAITSPPSDIPTGAELRELRTERKLTLTAVSSRFATAPITISRIERGLTYDNRLAREIRSWLIEHTPDTSASPEPAT